MATKQTSKGRPSYTPLQKAVSALVKATDNFNILNAEFEALIGVTADDEGTERYADIMEVVDARKSLAEEKDSLTQIIRQMNKENNTAKAEQLEARRKEVEEELRQYPPLGFTFEEFEQDGEAQVVELDRGRPAMEIEVRMVRAERELQEARRQAIALAAEEDMDESDIDAMVEAELNKDVKPGRPKNDQIGRLDKRVLDLTRKIEYIESGEAEQDRIAKQNISEKGSLRGRKPEPLNEILTKLKRELADVKERIVILEGKLDAKGQLERKLKIIRDSKRQLKKDLLDANPNLSAYQLAQIPEMVEILTQEEAIMEQINAAGGNVVTKKPVVREDKTNQKAQVIAQSKKNEFNAQQNEDALLKEELDEEEARLQAQMEELRKKRQMLKAANA